MVTAYLHEEKQKTHHAELEALFELDILDISNRLV
jgi:hypothetical protein